MERELEKLNRFLTQWRASHRAPTPLPTKVWTKAVMIAERLGPSVTAKALRLDYRTLREKMGMATASTPPEFVEVFQPFQTQPAALDCILEVHSLNGSRLRVEAKGLPVTELAAMVREFRG